MSVKEIIVEKYGSINAFVDIKAKEFNGELPFARYHFYKLLDHEVENPGIKTLNALADMVGIPRDDVYREYSE